MAITSLDRYYKGLFKNEHYPDEIFKEINRAHVVSSEYYDVRYGRNSLVYRDRENKFIVPIEHGVDHKIYIYFKHFCENKETNIEVTFLKNRILKTLAFLEIDCLVE
jgi:hypothetical protein